MDTVGLYSVPACTNRLEICIHWLSPTHELYTMHHYLEHVCYACASNMRKQNTQPTYPTQKIQFETQHTSEMLPDGEETIIHQRLQK